MEILLYGGVLSFAVVAVLGPVAIPLLHRLKFGQVIREDGPAAHKAKTGTPTMGGLMMLAGAALPVLVFYPGSRITWLMFLTTLGCGLVGFLDDYIKVVLKRNLGLRAKEKFLLLVILALTFSWFVTTHTARGTGVWIPGTGWWIELGWLFHVLVFFVLVGTTNAVNLTDGLDGLAAGTSVAAMSVYAVAALRLGQVEVAGFFLIMVGASVGFLLFNRHPAKIFMGDTGSLALGGTLAAGAVITGTELVLPLIGGVFVAEALSVIIQVVSFKSTGKRVFRMAPLHHHFELGGWPETRVVLAFWTAGCLLGLLGLWVILAPNGGRLI